MFRSIAAAVAITVVAVSSSSLSAQTIYAPVQHQYGSGDHRYYYGGSDPAVFERAERQRCLDEMTDYPYTSARYNDAYVHFRLLGQLDRVYSDCVPYMNARVFGYLPVDAANDANANVPRYFRKVELLRGAVMMPDGSRVVPAAATPVVTDRDLYGERAATRPVIKPRAIIIIPKKAPKTSDKQVASAAQ
jgi:hypothetical protein